jgi:predicted glycoside hydrolase/deacetylase ChbG (UPF0249 family)
MTKRIVLCADDYGQAPEISQGILALVKYGRLSATSCMVNADHWLEHASWLAPLKANVDVGLHLNLTEGKALSAPFIAKYGENLFTLNTVIRLSVLRLLDKAAIQAEFSAQLDRFKEGLGVLPDFIDGHQHVHQFPIVRDAFIQVYQERFKRTQKPYVRSVRPKLEPTDFIKNFKKVIIYFLGANPFIHLLDEHEIPYNTSYSGIYDFSKAGNFRDLFIVFLKDSESGGIIMCHPGLQGSASQDPIADARFKEYEYLFGEHFLYDCHQQKVVLGRFYT